MHRWRMATVLAVVSSLAQAAVVVECDYRSANRPSKLSVTEDADAIEFRLEDAKGVWLAEALRLGRRGEFTRVVVRFPKGADECGTQGTPATELWCKTSQSLNFTFTRRNGRTLETVLETPGLDLAIGNGDRPTQVAYRLFGARPLANGAMLTGAENGAFAGPICHR